MKILHICSAIGCINFWVIVADDCAQKVINSVSLATDVYKADGNKMSFIDCVRAQFDSEGFDYIICYNEPDVSDVVDTWEVDC